MYKDEGDDNMAVTIDYYDGKRYWGVIEGVSKDIVVLNIGGEQKNFTRALINKIYRNFVTE